MNTITCMTIITVKGACMSTASSHISVEIVVPEVESYLEVFMCEVASCAKSKTWTLKICGYHIKTKLTSILFSRSVQWDTKLHVTFFSTLDAYIGWKSDHICQFQLFILQRFYFGTGTCNYFYFLVIYIIYFNETGWDFNNSIEQRTVKKRKIMQELTWRTIRPD